MKNDYVTCHLCKRIVWRAASTLVKLDRIMRRVCNSCFNRIETNTITKWRR